MKIDNEGLHDWLVGMALANLPAIDYERALGEVEGSRPAEWCNSFACCSASSC